MVGPEALVGDQVADDRVVGAVLQDRVAEPGDEPAAAEQEERAVLGADEGPGEPLGQVVGASAVVQQVVEPGVDPSSGRPGLEPADLLQRRDRAAERQRQPPHHGQLGGRQARDQPCSAHRRRKRRVDRFDDRPEVVVRRRRGGAGRARGEPSGRRSPAARVPAPPRTTPRNSDVTHPLRIAALRLVLVDPDDDTRGCAAAFRLSRRVPAPPVRGSPRSTNLETADDCASIVGYGERRDPRSVWDEDDVSSRAEVAAPRPRRTLGARSRLRPPRRSAGSRSAVEWLFGIVSLVLGLSMLAALPVAPVPEPGLLAGVVGPGRRGRGRLRDGLIGVRRAARVGGLAAGIWLALVPALARCVVRPLGRADRPGRPVARGWRAALVVVTGLTVFTSLRPAPGAAGSGTSSGRSAIPFWLVRRLRGGGSTPRLATASGPSWPRCGCRIISGSGWSGSSARWRGSSCRRS